jgi:dihydroneopterin aldolase
VYTVEIEGLEFYGFHGVPEAERVVGHRYRIDLWIQVNGKADQSDDINDTVDYGELATKVLEKATELPVKTLEYLASQLIQLLIESSVLILRVEIRLAKLLPPAPIIASSAAVRMARSR